MSKESSRWTYVLGSRPEGVAVYDGGSKLHSHHDTDPARGQHNAFDVVRLHRFGHLDEGYEGPINQAPSHLKMVELAMADPAVQKELAAASDFDIVAEPEPAPPLPITAPPVADGERRRFQVHPPEEFAARKPLDWLVKGVLPRAELAVVYGAPGSGKSFLMLDLVAALQCGLPAWRGHRVQPGRAIMLVAEGIGGFRQRMQAYCQHHDADLTRLPGVIPEAPNLTLLPDTDDLIRAVLAWGPTDLIVIDTLSAVTPGSDENSGEDMGKVLSHCKRLHKATEQAWGRGAMVLLVHHSGKDASRGARGWSGLRAAADVEIEVYRNGEERAAKLTKMKDGMDGLVWPFALKTVDLGVDADGDLITSCVIDHDPAASHGRRPLAGVRGILYDVAREALLPGDTVSVRELLDEVVRRLPKDEGAKRDLRRQHATRALQRLVEDNYLFLPSDERVAISSAAAASNDAFEGTRT